MTRVLRLKDLEFSIDYAELTGHLNGAVEYDGTGCANSWYLEVKGEGKLFGDEQISQILSPRFYWSLPINIDDWRKLEGVRLCFDLETDDDEDDAPFLYLCAHLELPKTELRLGRRQANAFSLHWNGLADANWDEQYGDSMPFSMEFPIEFTNQEVCFWQVGDDESQNDEYVEAMAREIMKTRGLSDEALRFSHWERMRNESDDYHYRWIRAMFIPMVE
ncbi:hypothetical protein D3C76_279370 [compost metagenome]